MLEPEIRAIIDAVLKGDVNAMIGQAEGRTIEAKRQPYDLTKQSQQLELAKDITAFANATGGVLLLGFSTAKDAVHQVDVITGVNPIPLDRFDRVQYLQWLRNLTWPNVDVEIHVVRTDSQSGIVVMIVPAAEEDKRPILVTKHLPQDSQKTSDTVFGYYERTRADNFAFDPKRIHAILRSGLFYEDHMRGEFEYLRSALGNPREVLRIENVDTSQNAVNVSSRGTPRQEPVQRAIGSAYYSDASEIETLVRDVLQAAELTK